MCGTCGWHQLGKNISGLHVLWLKMVGWQHSDCFTSNFIQNIHPETTAVLVCDSHNSYIGVGLVENARKYNIVPLKLPSNCLCILFSTKIPIMWIFCISGWLAIPINLDKWSSTVFWFLNSHVCITNITFLQYHDMDKCWVLEYEAVLDFHPP